MQNYRNISQDQMRYASCSCRQNPMRQNPANDALIGLPLAMAYVPWQQWSCPYEAMKGFHRGTLFEDLDKPFMPRGGMMR